MVQRKRGAGRGCERTWGLGFLASHRSCSVAAREKDFILEHSVCILLPRGLLSPQHPQSPPGFQLPGPSARTALYLLIAPSFEPTISVWG